MPMTALNPNHLKNPHPTPSPTPALTPNPLSRRRQERGKRVVLPSPRAWGEGLGMRGLRE
jgi:hypothetical protein